ncbi:MAG: VCBS repeat-containing protein [Ignavibacteriaceae bacterium]
MKKLYKEEIVGSGKELRLYSFLLFVMLFFNESFSQVPINGFCKLNSFKVDSDYTSLFSLNFNKDSHTDLILFNPTNKQLTTLTGDKAGNFGKKLRFRIPYEITNIISYRDNFNRVLGYAFTSRKSRRMGIYDFTKSGKPYLKKVYKFDSYPDNISSTNLNNDKSESFLISGSAFNGLSIISEDKKGLQEKKIVTNISYTNAIFVDINSDGYPDIVAYNLFENTLDFFENNANGDFKKTRTLKIKDKINSLQNFDVNLDGYQDIVYSVGNSVSIVYGDSVSSYDSTLTVETSYYPDKIILGDFNRDGKIDFAYVNKPNSILSIIFKGNESEFYPEIIYLKKDGISDLIPYYSKFINGIVLISTEGYLYLESSLLSMTGDVDISLGAEPTALSFFDVDNNGIMDLCFVDKFTNSLKLIVRNTAGIPSLLYSTKLFESQSRVTVDNLDPQQKTFYCFKPDNNLIEVISYNFSNGKTKRYSLYTPGKIKEVKIYSKKNDTTKLLVVNIKNGKLILSTFYKSITGFNNSEFTDISDSVFAASVATVPVPRLFYWKINNGKQIWYRVSLSDNFKKPVKYFQLSLKDTTLLNSFAGDLFNKDEAVSINFFETKNNNFALLSSGNSPVLVASKNFINHFRIKNKNQLFFGEMKPGGLEKLYIYVPGESELYKIDFIKRGKEVVITKVIDAANVDSYFVKNMNYKDNYLVYTDSVEHCIKIRQIN